jgi:hypothetical protein
MAATMLNHIYGLSILKSGRQASRVDTAAMASISNTGASGLRAEAPAGCTLGRTDLFPESAITDLKLKLKKISNNKT